MRGCKCSLIYLIVFAFFTCKICQATGVNACGEDKFPCDDSECIPRRNWCDGEVDCWDESDEQYCKKKGWFVPVPVNHCTEKHFVCENGACVPAVARCDGIDDCSDWTDEDQCEYGYSLPDWRFLRESTSVSTNRYPSVNTMGPITTAIPDHYKEPVTTDFTLPDEIPVTKDEDLTTSPEDRTRREEDSTAFTTLLSVVRTFSPSTEVSPTLEIGLTEKVKTENDVTSKENTALKRLKMEHEMIMQYRRKEHELAMKHEKEQHVVAVQHKVKEHELAMQCKREEFELTMQLRREQELIIQQIKEHELKVKKEKAQHELAMQYKREQHNLIMQHMREEHELRMLHMKERSMVV